MKMIRLLVLLACALLLAVLACAENEEEPAMYTVTPNWENVKPLGRTHQLPDSLWMCFSGSGAEFTFHGARCEVTIAGDNKAYPGDREDRKSVV